MKILFLSRLYKPHVGGVEKHLEKISQILSQNHEITIITERHDHSLPEIETYPETTVYRIPVGESEKTKKFTIWKWFLFHLNLINQADVIHIHDVFFWILPFRIFYPRKKIFITFHGYEGSAPPTLRQIFWHKLGEWGTLGNICIGDFHAKWYKTKPDIVSYGAVDHVRKTNQPANKSLIYLGRLDKDTGILDYLAAAKKLHLPIDVYGDGPQLVQAKLLCKQNNIRAKFHGFVPNADSYITSNSIVFTSRYLGILESLAARGFTISHYDSPIKYDYLSLAPFAGFIDICGTAREIYIATESILTSPKKYHDRLTAGYNWAITQTWEKLVSQYVGLWQKNLSK